MTGVCPTGVRTRPCCAQALAIPPEEIWAAHQEAKDRLLATVKERSGRVLAPDLLTVGFARRSTAYKRADLLFRDIERLRAIGGGRLQLVYAGKAHPRDGDGKQLIQRVFAAGAALGGDVPVVYLEDYGVGLAGQLVAGVDLWLNTPLRPLEASGTSGMKAAHNGVPSLSVLDGWWIEGCVEGVTGWSIGGAYDPTSGPRWPTGRTPRTCTASSSSRCCRPSTEIACGGWDSCSTRSPSMPRSSTPTGWFSNTSPTLISTDNRRRDHEHREHQRERRTDHRRPDPPAGRGPGAPEPAGQGAARPLGKDRTSGRGGRPSGTRRSDAALDRARVLRDDLRRELGKGKEPPPPSPGP